MYRERVTRRNLAIVGVLALAGLYLAHTGLFRRYVNDDAFITFRYSRALASGQGPYYNPGEHVEGYTNFLLMVLLAPVIDLGGDDWALPAAKTIGVAAGLAGLLLAAALVKLLLRDAPSGPVATILATGLLASAPFYAVNSMSGLETTLYGALLAAGCCLALRAEETGRWCGAGAVFGLAALTRPEGAMIFGAWTAARVMIDLIDERKPLAGPRGRRILLDTAVVAAVVGAQLVFRVLWYDGEWLPNTYWAKFGGSWRAGPWPYVRFGVGAPFLGIAGVLAGFVGFFLDPAARRRGIPLCAAAAVAALSPFATGSDWMLGYRLIASYLPLLAVVVAIGWCRIGQLVVRRPAWLGAALPLVLLPVAWLTQQPARANLRNTVHVRAEGYEQGHRALVDWLRAGVARPGDTVALMDIGIVGYVGHDLRILDTSGLTDRFIAKSPGTFLQKEYDPGYVLRRRPEFIVIVLAAPVDSELPPPLTSSSPWTPIEHAIVTHPDFRRDYTRPARIASPGADWTEQFAHRIGAERVFEHAYPKRRYLLAVYARAGRRAG